jgi:hypothetical protein
MVLYNLTQAESHPNITPLATLYLGTMFVACMVCHGEVFRLRPGASRLTGYYLSISAGGAAGGLFVALVAPFIFPDYFELHLALFLTAALVLGVLRQDAAFPLQHGKARWGWAVLLLLLPAFGYGLYDVASTSLRGAVSVTRGFYGVLKVIENDAGNPELHHLTLQHGATIHGLQYVDPEKRTNPSSYYTSTSGVGRLLRTLKPEGGRRGLDAEADVGQFRGHGGGHRQALIVGTDGVLETEYLNHTAARVGDNAQGYLPSQMRLRRGPGMRTPFEAVSSPVGSGFRFAAEAFAAKVVAGDHTALARAAEASLDNAGTLAAIARSARLGQAVAL